MLFGHFEDLVIIIYKMAVADTESICTYFSHFILLIWKIIIYIVQSANAKWKQNKAILEQLPIR